MSVVMVSAFAGTTDREDYFVTAATIIQSLASGLLMGLLYGLLRGRPRA